MVLKTSKLSHVYKGVEYGKLVCRIYYGFLLIGGEA